MLRTIPRRSLWRNTFESRVALVEHRSVPAIHRHYVDDKKPPSDAGTTKKPSNHVTSIIRPSDPQTPLDRIQHQKEETNATKTIFEGQSETGESPSAESVSVNDVSNDNPDAVKKEPGAMNMNGLSGRVGEPLIAGGVDKVKPQTNIPRAIRESIGYEKTASSNVPPSPRHENPTRSESIHDVIGDGQRPVILEKSYKANRNRPQNDQQLLAKNQHSSTDTTKPAEPSGSSDQPSRNSILDLFDSENKTKVKKPRKSEPPNEQNFNPLSAHQLDNADIDLSPWEAPHKIDRQDLNQGINPDDCAGVQRGSWETEEVVPSEPMNSAQPTDEEIKAIQEAFNNLPKPKLRRQKKTSVDLDPSTSEATQPSPWDYFYPPMPPADSLSSALRDENRDSRARTKSAQDVYDPFAHKEKIPKWPFMYNRDALLELCAKHLMRHGKKASAEKQLQAILMRILEHYPRRHPVTLLAEAIDRNAPILKNAVLRDRSGSRMSIQPFPLFEKQRIRIGFLSMVKAANDQQKGRGIHSFPERFMREVIKVMEGRGAGLPFRIAEHKKAIQNRLNLQIPRQPGRMR